MRLLYNVIFLNACAAVPSTLENLKHLTFKGSTAVGEVAHQVIHVEYSAFGVELDIERRGHAR